MSTSNIIGIEDKSIDGEIPTPIVEVTFQARRGARTYRYIGPAALAILAGADPAQFPGVEV